MIGIYGSLIWAKILMQLIFNPCGEFRWSPAGQLSQIHSPHLNVAAPGIFSDLLRSVQMPEREWDAESNGKLPHLFNPSKTATLVPAFAVKDLPLARILWWWWWWFMDRLLLMGIIGAPTNEEITIRSQVIREEIIGMFMETPDFNCNENEVLFKKVKSLLRRTFHEWITA